MAAKITGTDDIGKAQRDGAAATPSFREAYAKHRADWAAGKGDPTFSWNGNEYSVATREEAARNKAMRESSTRGRGTNRADMPAPRAEIPKGGDYKAPASTGSGMSETRRNLQNIASAMPAVGAATSTVARTAGLAAKGGKAAVDAGRGAMEKARAASDASKAAKEYVKDPDRVKLKHGGLVKRASAKSHGKAC